MLNTLHRIAHFSTRTWCLVTFILAITSMAFAVVILQLVMELTPCPLCVLDRLVIVSIALIAVGGIAHNPTNHWRFLYGVPIFILSCIGCGICLWHIHLQNLPPDQVPSCGPGFDYIVDTFPLWKALSIIFAGSGECAEQSWTFLGFTIAEQTLGVFITFVVLSIGIMLNKEGKPLKFIKWELAQKVPAAKAATNDPPESPQTPEGDSQGSSLTEDDDIKPELPPS